MKKTILFIFILFNTHCFSQHSYYLKDSLLKKVYRLQTMDDSRFSDGIFISERFKGINRNLKEDNNIFFPALVNYTLQSVKNDFSSENRQLIDSISVRVERNYFRYQNRKGDVSYNFWQTHPDMPMPGSKLWSKSEKAKLPDDLDCTSIIYLTLDKNDSMDNLLKQKIIRHTNLYDRQIKSIFRRYQDHKAYLTWFANRLKQDFDICVMANTMLYIFDRGFELNEYDKETIRLIEDMVFHNDHIRYPHIISPYYKNPFIIFYHLARMIAADKKNVFVGIREKIIADILHNFEYAHNRMEKILMLSSLLRMNVKTDLSVDLKGIEKDFRYFNYFVVNPFHGSNITVKRILGRSEFLHYFYRCDAYYWTLIIEYLALSEKHILEK